jgi:hypothetical protein
MTKPQLGILHFIDGSAQTYDLTRFGANEFWETTVGTQMKPQDPNTTVSQKELVAGKDTFRTVEPN